MLPSVAGAEAVPRPVAGNDGSLPPGVPVEVRNRFTLGWSRGFVVEGMVDEGYVVRRASDAALLPLAFDPQDVRPAPRP
jgi:hypothetical protein